MQPGQITVIVKIYSHIDQELRLTDYNPAQGIEIVTPSGTRLKQLLKTIGIANPSAYIFFRNTIQIGPWEKLHEGDVIHCLKLAGGG